MFLIERTEADILPSGLQFRSHLVFIVDSIPSIRLSRHSRDCVPNNLMHQYVGGLVSQPSS